MISNACYSLILNSNRILFLFENYCIIIMIISVSYCLSSPSSTPCSTTSSSAHY